MLSAEGTGWVLGKTSPSGLLAANPTGEEREVGVGGTSLSLCTGQVGPLISGAQVNTVLVSSHAHIKITTKL